MLWISIILAFLSLVYAGFLYVVSGANSNIRAKAFDRVKRIVTGSLILLLAVLILSFINTDLVRVEEGLGEAVVEEDINDLSNNQCALPTDRPVDASLNVCRAPLPTIETEGLTFADYNYIGNNYAFIDYNNTLTTRLQNFVGDYLGIKNTLKWTPVCGSR